MDAISQTQFLPAPRVLVVDDSPEQLELLTRTLSGAGYEIETGTCAREGLEKVRESLPDVLLLDVMLPDGDGIEICRELRRDPTMEDVAIVLISSEKVEPETKAYGIESGANDYFGRPMPKRELLARISSQVRLLQMRRCLKKAQAELEARVAERTRELTETNQKLQREIDERRRAEQSLRESEERFRVITENIGDLITLLDDKGGRAYISPSYERVLGYSDEEMCKIAPGELVHPQDAARMKRAPASQPVEFRARHANGSWVWLEASSHPIQWRGKNFSVAIARDITDRKRAEAERNQLPRKILAAQDAERRRVSQELHDGVSQLLATVRLRVDTVEAALPPERIEDRATLSRAGELIGKAIDDIRRITRNLRPNELDDLGLLPALRGAVEEFMARTGISVAFSSRLPETRLPAQIELNLYRIVQEALTNVEKHAKASKVIIELRQPESEIVLHIKDDGVGVKASPADAQKQRAGGLGLLNMAERAAACNGTCEIRKKPGVGVEIIVRIPFRESTSKSHGTT
jgi:PAS domain S-box-containing protein